MGACDRACAAKIAFLDGAWAGRGPGGSRKMGEASVFFKAAWASDRLAIHSRPPTHHAAPAPAYIHPHSHASPLPRAMPAGPVGESPAALFLRPLEEEETYGCIIHPIPCTHIPTHPPTHPPTLGTRTVQASKRERERDRQREHGGTRPWPGAHPAGLDGQEAAGGRRVGRRRKRRRGR